MRGRGRTACQPQLVAFATLVVVVTSGCSAPAFDGEAPPLPPGFDDVVGEGEGSDPTPVEELPQDPAGDLLLVSTVDDARPELLIDTGSGETVSLPGAQPGCCPAPPRFLGDGLVWTVGPGELAMSTGLDGTVSQQVTLPSSAAGDIAQIEIVDGLIAVSSRLDPAEPGHLTIIDRDGTIVCSEALLVRGGLAQGDSDGLWIWGTRIRLDLTTCSADPAVNAALAPLGWGEGVRDPDNPQVRWVTRGEAVIRVEGPDDDEVARHEGLVANDLAFGSAGVLVAAGGRVLLLDSATLEVIASTEVVLGCNPFFIETDDERLFVVDDCAAVLLEIDPSTADVIGRWSTPHDGMSDSELHVRTTPTNLWFVDLEQTGVPYRFDLATETFHQPPIPTEVLDIVYATDFAVRAP